MQKIRAKSYIFAHFSDFLYLCAMKAIVFRNPIDYMRGNLSGRQSLEYGTNDSKAYDQPTGEKTAANNYQPRLVAKVLRAPYANRRRYFQVRTRTSVNMTDAMRNNMALMGGAGALYGAIIRQNGDTYRECVYQWQTYAAKGETFRAFVIKAIRVMLENGTDYGDLGDSEVFENPWKLGNDNVLVPVPSDKFDKFNDVLSNL